MGSRRNIYGKEMQEMGFKNSRKPEVDIYVTIYMKNWFKQYKQIKNDDKQKKIKANPKLIASYNVISYIQL